MSIAVFFKNNLKQIPPTFGKLINRIPYAMRPGLAEIYSQRIAELKRLESAKPEEQRDFAFNRIKSMVSFAYHNVRFYNQYYRANYFCPDDLVSFNDIVKIPIVTKSILNKVSIEDRSYQKRGRYIVNTGGSSGTPFNFYIEPSSMGHEWAHIHAIWRKLGYKPSDLKLVFSGRSNVRNVVEYDVVRNSFMVDIYADFEHIAKKLIKIIDKHEISYLHGYPSSIYEFATYCAHANPRLRELLTCRLKGAFLGSEYPHKHYREAIERIFELKTISWYGHTERAVLAYEKKHPFKYEPFLTYGFSEAVLNANNEHELISTSYYNQASPIIRYNTQDIIDSPMVENGILQSFQVLNGRSGEFVIDKTGKKIALTGLIFGRHHEIFNHCKFIQVRQLDYGAIEILYVADLTELEAESLFDKENLNLEIYFRKIDEPIRTISGKVGLLIK